MNYSNILISQANETHHAMVAKTAAETFYETFRPYNTEEDIQAYIQKAYQLDLIKQQLESSNYVFFLAYFNNEVAGYAKLIPNSTYNGLIGNSIELEKIYVYAKFQGIGVAQELLNSCVDWSVQQHYNTLFLGVWQENKRAIRFYEKEGFTTFNTRTFQLGDRLCDDYMMKKTL
ncbi:MAG: GNAT family N-acetyltransferase [Bacteroidota bacterium]